MFTEQRKQMKEKMQVLHSETREQLSGILNEEQLAKYDEMQAKRMEKMKDRFKHRHDRNQERDQETSMESDS